MIKALCTIGYEGASPEQFDAVLAGAGVDVVVDVREVTVSRRRGFSKTALAARLADRGIGYLHLKGLGDPKPGRLAARAGDFAKFRRIFADHMQSVEAQSDLQQLADIVPTRRVALLCYEAEPSHCHRAIVANWVAKLANIEIMHLRVDRTGAAQGGCAGTMRYPGEGLAAAE